MLKKVEKGQKFKPSATFHNKVVDTVNAMDGFKSIGHGKGQSNDIRINFVNTLGEEIPAGAPLVIDSYDEKNNLFKVRKFKEDDTVYGVNKTLVEKNKIGTAIMFGTAKISVSGEKKKFVSPVPDKFEWQYSEVGFPVLCPCADGVLILLPLGSSGNSLATPKDDMRPFFATYNPETNMIDVTGGWVLANGESLTANAGSLGVQNGLICVTAERVDGSYKTPLLKYGNFAPNSIPIARVTVINYGVIDIVNFYVSTAIFMATIPHPPCECIGGTK